MLKIPKSMLSDWLSSYFLTKRQLKKLTENVKKRKHLGIEKTRITKAKKRKKRLRSTYAREKTRLLPLTKRELYLCGLLLYWGEGAKGIRNTYISLNNTDPKVIKFYYYWLLNSLSIPKERIRVAVYLYNDMDVEESLNYWSEELGIPREQFIKPYIKKSLRKNLDHKGYGRGTCGLNVYDVRLKERIMLGIKAIADYYSGKISKK